MTQSGKIQNEEIIKSLWEILLSSILDIISKCVFLKSLVEQGDFSHLQGKVSMTEIKSRENISCFEYQEGSRQRLLVSAWNDWHSIRAVI